MPIKYVDHYSPEDCRNNPNDLYVFGDNFQRKGKAGQAVIRDEKNTVGIATKGAPSMHEHAFLENCDYNSWDDINTDAFNMIEAHLANLGIVVLPQAGLGTGYAQLDTRAPKIFAELQAWVRRWEEKYGVCKS